MKHDIKDLRRSTGMTQKAFAAQFGIPLSTLRKWEQGESSPPSYVADLIAARLPATDASLLKLKGRNGEKFFYDRSRMAVLDSSGNSICITEDLEGVKEQNLQLYLSELFTSFYEIQKKFERDCRYDKEEDIIWV